MSHPSADAPQSSGTGAELSAKMHRTARFGRGSLLLRNLRHYWAADLAVIAGMAIAAAVLSGALMVGDSVRDSLRDLAVERMGPVDDALVSPHFFDQSLAERIATSPGFSENFQQCVPAISVRGGAGVGDAGAPSGGTDHSPGGGAVGEAIGTNAPAHTAGVQIMAVGGDWVPLAHGQCSINGELAQALDITSPGRELLLSVPAITDMPADATLARRGRSDTTANLRARVDRIASAPGFESMFNIAGGQRLPRNSWVTMGDLQDAIGQTARANMLLVSEKHGRSSAQNSDSRIAELAKFVHASIRLSDYGLSIVDDGAHVMLDSRSTYIPAPVIAAARGAGDKIDLVSAYLANTITVRPHGTAPRIAIHYAIVAGIGSLDGDAIPTGGVVINQWTADHLHAAVGDSIELRYYHRRPDGTLSEVDSNKVDPGHPLTIVRILPMTGLGADPTLTPSYPGLTNADSIADWSAPEGVTIDQSLVTKDDEAYWKQHRAAPKLFVNLAEAHRLWGDPMGEITGIRLPAGDADAFTKMLLQKVDPRQMGMSFDPIKARQIAAAEGGGSNDFAMIFLSFSFFLIFSAVLLVAMLFRLSVEQRARQLGLLAAIGFAPKAVRRMALAEGAILAVIGSAIGVALGVGYTALMMAGLRTWWIDAVGIPQLHVHVESATLATGFISAVIIAMLAVWWGAWRVGRTAAARLLAGAWGDGRLMPSQSRWLRIVAIVLAIIGIALIAMGIARIFSAEEAFMSGGGVLLIACLLGFSGAIRPRRPRARKVIAPISLVGLAIRNASRHAGRSVLVVGLIAFATFILVTIASMRSSSPPDVRNIASGSGGFELMLHSDLPLYGNLSTPAGRELLGIRDSSNLIWNRTTFDSLRSSAGQDVSCLNLTQPTQPTLLAIPLRMMVAKRFTFARVGQKNVKNPWLLLNGSPPAPSPQSPQSTQSAAASTEPAAGPIPVIADDQTAQYILKLDIGQTMNITDEAGRTRQLVLVATLNDSIFQGQLLVSQPNFASLFPSRDGFHFVLAQARSADVPELRRRLGSELMDYSVTVESTADVLAGYQRVANTYMATFQTLGSLGLLLGTVGLTVVLLRSLIERRSELAMLAALGFSRTRRLRLVLTENVGLLVAGLLIGAACAIVAVLPAIFSAARKIHLVQLAGALALIFCTGVLVLIAASWFGGRKVTIEDLRFE